MLYEGLDPAALADRLRVPSCLALERVTSTLDIIHQMAREGAPAGTMVLADEQVEGRGRLGRQWYSPKGAGIWLGCLQRSSHPIEGGVLALRIGMSVVNALNAVGVGAKIKWPNDVLVFDRKVAGVLCEARHENGESWVAIGIGINVYGPLSAELGDVAIALDDASTGVTRLDVLDALTPHLLEVSSSPVLTAAERGRYLEHDWLSGRQLVGPVAGEARGIDPDGALLVATAASVERVLGGSVVAA